MERGVASVREEIEEILVDCYGEHEEASAWEVAFTDGAQVPFGASLLGMPVEVRGFRISNANVLQCLVVREKHLRWVGVEGLDEEGPEEFRHVLALYRMWMDGGY